jgi:glycosyltransferase involved in cell wall biosynthesis
MNASFPETFLIAASDGKSLLNFRGPFIRFLVSQGHKVICSSIEPPQQIESEINALGAQYRQVSGSRVGIGISDGLKMIKEYRKLLKDIKPDICFFYMSKPTVFGSVAAFLSKAEHINILVNGLENAFYRNGLKDFIVRAVMTFGYRFASKNADNVFFQNNDDYNYFMTHNIHPRNALVVGGSGVDMQYFAKQPLPDAPVFLMVARLLFSKGIREYLEAAAKLKKEHPDASIMLVGGLDNNDESLSKEELNRYIANSEIEYCGFAEDVRPYLAKCSVFVLPSYHEGLPRSVIEAMAVGRAIITTDVPGCRETVKDGVNGFIVPKGQSNPLAQKMAVLAGDSELRKTMAEQSYQMCLERFEVGKVNRQMYDSMINSFKN